ncbi:MAG TPA: PEGA domain-containing protein [Candidatus Nanopelagicales bacterium]|nr:PEGA domain-containing protein [Candidatus Nanopelagicales bacterium]
MMPGFPSARSIVLALLVCFSCVAAAPDPAFAQGGAPPSRAAVEEAKRRFQRGRELYEENDFQGALVEMRRAYELAPTYRLLYDIGQVYYQLQDYPNALRTFTKFLQDGRGEITQQQRDDVQREIDKLRGRVATLRITTNRLDAEISIDDVPVGKTPLADPILVSPGRRKITATLKGHAPAIKTVEIAGQETQDVSLDLAEPATPGEALPPQPPVDARQPAPMASSGQSIAPIAVAWTVTGACAIGAAVTGGLALGASSDLASKRETLGSSRTVLDDAKSQTQTLALVSDVFLVATAVGAGVSIYLTATHGSSASPAPKTGSASSVRVGLGPGSVSLAGTF